MNDKVRYGFLGASQIIKNQHGRAFAEASNAQVLSIASRRPSKAREFAAALNIPHVHETYESMLADPDIEAVLITLPMTLHCEWAIRAVEAGKHVLCEKPLVLSVDEGERVLRAAKANNRLVLEAFTHVYPEQYQHVQNLIAQGAIGELRAVRAEVLYPTLDWDNDSRAQPQLGGRVLIEAGCYCIKTIRDLMSEEPTEVHGCAAHRNDGELQTTFVGIMKFSRQRLGYFCASMETAVRISADVIGTAGRVEMPDLFNASRIHIFRTGEQPQEIRFETSNRFRQQVEHFSHCIRHGTQPIVSLEDSLNNIRILQALNDTAYS